MFIRFAGDQKVKLCRESLKRWVEANKMKFKEGDNEILILSLKEMATYGQAGGDLAGCYSYENSGFGC